MINAKIHLADDEQFLECFRREAQAVAALRYPHIVQVYDFGADGALYYKNKASDIAQWCQPLCQQLFGLLVAYQSFNI